MPIDYPPTLVGGLHRTALKSALTAAGVELNLSAVTLLESDLFAAAGVEMTRPVELSVDELGLSGGAQLSQILDTAQDHGLQPLPFVAAPYIRLATLDQTSAPNSILSNHRAPAGSISVAAPRAHPGDDAYPAGFYLRVIDGSPWLRGYHCTDDYLWPPAARFLFGRP